MQTIFAGVLADMRIFLDQVRILIADKR